MSRAFSLLAFLLTVAGAARSQEPPPPPPTAVPAILAGAGLGLAGFFAGGLVGRAASSGCASDDFFCSLEAAFVGAAVGGTAGMALGVHLGNRRNGNLALDFLTGAAVWGAGLGIVALSGWDGAVGGVMAVAIPIGQLAATVAVERASGRKRARA